MRQLPQPRRRQRPRGARGPTSTRWARCPPKRVLTAIRDRRHGREADAVGHLHGQGGGRRRGLRDEGRREVVPSAPHPAEAPPVGGARGNRKAQGQGRIVPAALPSGRSATLSARARQLTPQAQGKRADGKQRVPAHFSGWMNTKSGSSRSPGWSWSRTRLRRRRRRRRACTGAGRAQDRSDHSGQPTPARRVGRPRRARSPRRPTGWRCTRCCSACSSSSWPSSRPALRPRLGVQRRFPAVLPGTGRRTPRPILTSRKRQPGREAR